MQIAAVVIAAALVASNTLTNLVAPGDRFYSLRNGLLAVALVLAGLALGLSGDAMGLATTDLGDGWRWGRGAVLTVAVAVAAGAALADRVPPLRALLADRRADLPPRQLLRRVLVRIPVGTAALEEVAFRGLLLGLLLEAWPTAAAVAASSVAFGLWHVGPTLVALDENTVEDGRGRLVVGAVAATTVGGAVLCWLRLAAGHLLAPFLMHWALNAFGLLAAAVRHRTTDGGNRSP